MTNAKIAQSMYHGLLYYTFLTFSLVCVNGQQEPCEVIHKGATNTLKHFLVVGLAEAEVDEAMEAINQTADIRNISVIMVPAVCGELETNNLLTQELQKVNISTLEGVIGPDDEYLKRTVRLANPNYQYFTVGDVSSKSENANTLAACGSVHIKDHAKALAALVVSLNWELVTVIFGEDDRCKELWQALKEQLLMKSVCTKTLQRNGLVRDQIKTTGIIYLGADQQTNLTYKGGGIKNFTWIVSPHPMWREPPVVTGRDRVYVVCPNISLAQQLEFVISQKTGHVSADLAKMCTMSASSNTSLPVLKLVNITQDEHSKDVGTYDGEWDLSSEVTAGDPKRFWCNSSACQEECRKETPRPDYIFVQGKYVMVVTTPIHDQTDKFPNQYKCTRFNTEVSLRAEAALFTLKRLKELLKIDFGLLIVDSCYSSLVTQRLITDILKGQKSYCYDGECLDRSHIVGLIGDFSSHISVTEQQLIKPANLLQITYGGSTHRLDDKEVYTHLLRVHNSNTRVTSNVITLLDTLNQEQKTHLNSVVLITTDTEYGWSGRVQLKKKLKEAHYCIQKNLTLKYHVGASEVRDKYDTFWKDLYTSNEAVVIIYNGEEDPIRQFLDVMKESESYSSWWKSSGSIFIMVAVWENKKSLLNEYGEYLRGSLSFKVVPAFTYDRYTGYLQNFTLERAARNPWFAKAYQIYNKCKIPRDFSGNFSNSVCEGIWENMNDNITTDIYTVNMIKAMYALAIGIQKYTNSKSEPYERKESVAFALKQIIAQIEIPNSFEGDMTDGQGTLRLFNSKLDGTAGYEVYSQQFVRGRKEFVKVFTFSCDYDKIERAGYVKFYDRLNSANRSWSMKCNEKCSNFQCPAKLGLEKVLLKAALGVVSAILFCIMLQKPIRTLFVKSNCATRFKIKKDSSRPSLEEGEDGAELKDVCEMDTENDHSSTIGEEDKSNDSREEARESESEDDSHDGFDSPALSRNSEYVNTVSNISHAHFLSDDTFEGTVCSPNVPRKLKGPDSVKQDSRFSEPTNEMEKSLVLRKPVPTPRHSLSCES